MPGGPPRRQVAVAVAVVAIALIVTAATAALVVNRMGEPAAAPSTPVPTQAPPTPAPTEVESTRSEAGPGETESTEEAAEPTTPRARARGLRRLTRQVARVRGLPQERRLRARELGPKALADKISEVAAADADPKSTRATEQMLIALRLAEPGFDLAAVLDDLLRAEVKGFYVPEDRTLYIPRGTGPPTPGERRTAAHEITHALQDQTFDIGKVQETAGENSDAGLAVLSVIEGDASLTEELWSREFQSESERQAAASEPSGDPGAAAAAPPYLLASLFFPYQEGVEFVVDLYQEGGYEAVDAALRNPPTSTEQILHPEKYRSGEDPRPIRVRETPGDGWRETAAYDFGEFDIRELLTELGAGTADEVAAGWAGGQIKSWRRDGKTAVGLALRFDSAGDAQEACEALPRWYGAVADGRPEGGGVYAGNGDRLVVGCDGRQLHMGMAPDGDSAARLVP